MNHSSPIIVALDYAQPEPALALVEQLAPSRCRLKIGKGMFTALGPVWVEKLMAKGFDIFLDLKFHDIPHQIYQACTQAAQLGVWMVNVHALGGSQMLAAARAAIDEAPVSKKPWLIGVTLLTSLQTEDLAELGFSGTLSENVWRLAGLCHNAKLDGVVCSAQESALLKQSYGQDFLCVTPGIRLPHQAAVDQKRIMTPLEAIQAGSDYLVMGRSITDAADPNQLLTQIIQEMEHNL